MRTCHSHRGRNTLCLSQHREHTGSDSGGFCTGSGDLVGVDGLGCIGIGVPQLVGGSHGVNAVGDEDGGHGVAEGVGIDMGQVVGLAELVQPVGDAVRVHGPAVILREDEAAI